MLGEICHIKAQSPDGPRYDSAQSDKDRHNFDNLLLLCSSHHKVIDDDLVTYTVEHLTTFKTPRTTTPSEGFTLSNELLQELINKSMAYATNQTTTGNGNFIAGPGANQIILSTGVSYQDARKIAQDVFDANFLKLQEAASRTACERAEKLAENLFNRLRADSVPPAPFADPDMQYALFSAQKAAARSGSDELIDVLTDLLVHRTKAQDTDLERLVLNESIETAARLTPDQFDALSLIFRVRYARIMTLTSTSEVEHSLKTHLATVLPNASRTLARFQHLQFCGCGAFETGSYNLANLLAHSYTSTAVQDVPRTKLLQHIVTRSNLSREDIAKEIFSKHFHTGTSEDSLTLLPPYIRDTQQIDAPEEVLKNFNKGLQNLALLKFKSLISNKDSWLFQLDQTWQTHYARFSLTSVGIAIAITNLRRRKADGFSLSVWIN